MGLKPGVAWRGGFKGVAAVGVGDGDEGGEAVRGWLDASQALSQRSRVQF